jgi:adenosylhomocysteine nucleosidase
MTIVAVCGLRREARIAEGQGVTAVAASDAITLRRMLAQAISTDTKGLISFGIAGGLSPSLRAGDCVIASKVISHVGNYEPDADWHERMIARLPFAVSAPVMGLNRIVTAKAHKAELFESSGAHAADMESHLIGETARAHGLPFAVLRAISDPAASELPALVKVAVTPEGHVSIPAVLGSLLRDPTQISDVIRTARESNAAFAALLRCRRALGLRLLGPD